MKVSRYSVSGAIQSIGTDITSVVRCLVTPSSSADGTKDHASQRTRWLHVIVSSSGSTASVDPRRAASPGPRTRR